MGAQAVLPGLYRIKLSYVNAYLLEDAAGLTLVDTGMPGSEVQILAAVAALGRQPGDVKQIVVTHAHADHAGGLAALQRATGAPAYMHKADADLVRVGQSGRPFKPGPGLMNWMIARSIGRQGPAPVEPAAIEHELADGDVLPFGDGLRVVYAPGHCLGQVALLWPRHGGVLLAADTAGRMFGRLGYPVIFEDQAVGEATLRRLGTLAFEGAVFGHGDPLRTGAAAQFRRQWPGG